VSRYRRTYYQSRIATAAPVESEAPPTGTRGLLPGAVNRTLSSAAPPALRRIDDKGRIHHPVIATLVGWEAGCSCTVTVDGDFLRITPSAQPGRDRGRFDGKRLLVPAARLLAIGVAPGEDVAVLVAGDDDEAGTVVLAAGAHLTDAFWAVGDLEDLRTRLSEVTAERDAALADAAAERARADAYAELLERRSEHPTPALARTGR